MGNNRYGNDNHLVDLRFSLWVQSSMVSCKIYGNNLERFWESYDNFHGYMGSIEIYW